MVSPEKLQMVKRACLDRKPIKALHRKDSICINTEKAKPILYKKVSAIICKPNKTGTCFDYQVELADFGGSSVTITDIDDIILD